MPRHVGVSTEERLPCDTRNLCRGRACEESRVETGLAGRDPRPRMGHDAEAACPGVHGAKVFANLGPALHTARGLAAAVAGQGRRQKC